MAAHGDWSEDNSIPSENLAVVTSPSSQILHECCNSQQAGLHDIHGQRPEFASECFDSGHSNSSSEPSFRTKELCKQLNINYRSKKATSESAGGEITTDEPAQPNQLVEENVTEPVARQCDMISQTSSTTASTLATGQCNKRHYSTSSKAVLQLGNDNCIFINTKRTTKTCSKTASTKKRKSEDLKVPRRLINSDDIDMIAVHLGNDWRCFGTKLGFRKGELDAFEFDHDRDGLREIIYQMLLAWQEKKGTNAFVKDIVTQLIAVKRKDIAKMFRVD